MIPENSRRVIDMKQTLYNGSRKTTVNTKYDECLYLAPRPVSDQPDVKVTGKDLYIHVTADQDKSIMYLSSSLDYQQDHQRKDSASIAIYGRPVLENQGSYLQSLPEKRSSDKSLCVGVRDCRRILTFNLCTSPIFLFSRTLSLNKGNDLRSGNSFQ